MSLHTTTRRWIWFAAWLFIMLLGLANLIVACHCAIIGKSWGLPAGAGLALLYFMGGQYRSLKWLRCLPWDPTCPVLRRDQLVWLLYKADDRTRRRVLALLLKLDPAMYEAVKIRIQRICDVPKA